MSPAPEHAQACWELEGQLRTAIRDAVNRATRKPFYWGGLKGYQQLASIARILHALSVPKTAYWVRLLRQVDRTLEHNRPLAEMLATTYTWFLRMAACLRYPPSTYREAPRPTRSQVKQEMQDLLRSFASEVHGQAIPWALYGGLRKRWDLFADDLLHCFDIPGLPQDNLQVESLFGQLRSRQRRISGRKSTQPLREFGHSQIRFQAESQEQLLEQLQRVPPAEYREQRKRQAQAEAPRQFLTRLHRSPEKAMQLFASTYLAYQATFAKLPASAPLYTA